MLPLDQRPHIYSTLSNFNVVETLLDRLYVTSGEVTAWKPIAAYLDWVLAESEVRRYFAARDRLADVAVYVNPERGCVVLFVRISRSNSNMADQSV